MVNAANSENSELTSDLSSSSDFRNGVIFKIFKLNQNI